MSVPSFIWIERGSNRAHDFKLNKVLFTALKSVNINVSRSVAPKIALVPANRYYCDVKELNLNVCAKFH